MPTKRRKIAPTRQGIRPEAVEAWKRGAFWELHRALGRKVWQMPDWTEDPPEPRPAANWQLAIRAWEHLVAAKARLVELAGPPPRRWRYWSAFP